MDVYVNIDWISVTIPDGMILKLPSAVRQQKFTETKGMNGYTKARKFVSGVIELVNPDRKDMGTHLIYSGSTLKRLAQMGYHASSILRFHSQELHDFSRIDIAIDAFDSGLEIGRLASQVELGYAETNAKTSSYIMGNLDDAETLYIGSMKSRKKLLRVYNKAVEQGIDGDWVRIEGEFRRPSSNEIASTVADDHMNVKSTYQAVINGFCDFPCDETWSKIMTNNEIRMRVPESNSNNSTQQWLLNQCAPALAREVVANSEFMSIFMSTVNQHIKGLENE